MSTYSSIKISPQRPRLFPGHSLPVRKELLGAHFVHQSVYAHVLSYIEWFQPCSLELQSGAQQHKHNWGLKIGWWTWWARLSVHGSRLPICSNRFRAAWGNLWIFLARVHNRVEWAPVSHSSSALVKETYGSEAAEFRPYNITLAETMGRSFSAIVAWMLSVCVGGAQVINLAFLIKVWRTFSDARSGTPSFPVSIVVLIGRPNEILSVQSRVRWASTIDRNLLQDLPTPEPELRTKRNFTVQVI